MFKVKELDVEVEGKSILNKVGIEIPKGEVHAIMGPNGSGKSTLAHALMGHPSYNITNGSILIDDKDITKLQPHKRAQAGLFLSFQYPSELPGVSLATFMRTALQSVTGKNIPIAEFIALLKEKMALLGITEEMAKRHVNEGFSGEKRKEWKYYKWLCYHQK